MLHKIMKTEGAFLSGKIVVPR